MYQSAYYDRHSNTVHLIDDEKGYQKIDHIPYGYVLDEDGEFTNIYGQKVSLTYDIENYKNSDLWESDVNPLLRTLVDLYYDSDDISKNHRLLYWDIETKTTGGFSTPQEAWQPITAISMFFENREVALLVDDTLKSEVIDGVELIVFKNEKELLTKFIELWVEYSPTIITDWNGDYYDIPYTVNRIKKLFGIRTVQKLSPFGIVKENRQDGYTIAGVNHLDYMQLYKKFTYSQEPSYSLEAISQKELGEGKVEYKDEYGSLDNLKQRDPTKFINYFVTDTRLVKKLDNKLKFIELAQFICHKGHVTYEEVYKQTASLEGATLVFLKRNNLIAPNKKRPQKLKAKYNHKKGDNKLYVNNYIDRETTPLQGTIKIFTSKSSHFEVEYSKYEMNYFILKEPLKKPVLSTFELKIELPGAYVKIPLYGLYDWVYDLDLESLYPSIIRTLNISPETKMGRIANWNFDNYYDNVESTYNIELKNETTLQLTTIEFKEWLVQMNYSVSANGILFDHSKPGIIPTILGAWFDERVEFKNLMKKYKKEGNIDAIQLYHTKQLTQKILLNSYYGALAMATFRFYDTDNAEAVTSTGQFIIKFSEKAANIFYNQELNTNKNFVAVLDTDSIILSALPLLQHRHKNIDYNDFVFMSKATIDIASEVQTFINDCYSVFVKKYLNVQGRHYLRIKQEMVSYTFFATKEKKRYCQCIINEEGVQITNDNISDSKKVFDKDGKFIGKFDVKGLDVVRSDFPPAFKTLMKEVLIDILTKNDKANIDQKIADFKNNLKTVPSIEIMFPSGINNLKQYSADRRPFFINKGTPIHVKSAILYNDLLDKYNLNEHPKFSDMDKIKWCYLKNNPLKLDVLGLKGYEDPEVIVDYIEQYINKDDMFKSRLENKLTGFYDALNWGKLPDKNLNTINTFFSF